MSSLYDLTGDYAKFAFIAEQEDIDDEMKAALKDALSNLSDDIDDKLDGYTKVIKNFEADIEALDAEIKRLNKRKDHFDKTVNDLKESMKNAIISTTEPDKKGIVRRKGTLFSFTIKTNPEKVVWDVKELDLIPDKFKKVETKVETKLDTSLMKDLLQHGSDEEKEKVQGLAHLERTKSLLIM